MKEDNSLGGCGVNSCQALYKDHDEKQPRHYQLRRPFLAYTIALRRHDYVEWYRAWLGGTYTLWIHRQGSPPSDRHILARSPSMASRERLYSKSTFPTRQDTFVDGQERGLSKLLGRSNFKSTRSWTYFNYELVCWQCYSVLTWSTQFDFQMARQSWWRHFLEKRTHMRRKSLRSLRRNQRSPIQETILMSFMKSLILQEKICHYS